MSFAEHSGGTLSEVILSRALKFCPIDPCLITQKYPYTLVKNIIGYIFNY
jgi:hypothetical protein